MREPLRYNATKVVGEYGEQARLQHRLHLSPDANGKWVKWDDYVNLKDDVIALRIELAEAQENYHHLNKIVKGLIK
jgi:hypothetical protein